MSVNQIIVVGRLTKDVELRYTGSGKAIASFTVAVDRSYKTEDGVTPTDFHGVTVWGHSAERHAEYISKGKLVAVTGRLENNNYNDADGVKHYGYTINAHDVQYLSPKPVEDAPAPAKNARPATNTRSTNTPRR